VPPPNRAEYVPPREGSRGWSGTVDANRPPVNWTKVPLSDCRGQRQILSLPDGPLLTLLLLSGIVAVAEYRRGAIGLAGRSFIAIVLRGWERFVSETMLPGLLLASRAGFVSASLR